MQSKIRTALETMTTPSRSNFFPLKGAPLILSGESYQFLLYVEFPQCIYFNTQQAPYAGYCFGKVSLWRASSKETRPSTHRSWTAQACAIIQNFHVKGLILNFTYHHHQDNAWLMTDTYQSIIAHILIHEKINQSIH